MTYQRFNKKDRGFTPHHFLKKNGEGFTLIEMLVAITIFSILMIAVVGVFVSALRIQRYYLASQWLLNETSYVMEYTSRFIRMAQKDDGSISCISLGSNYEPSNSTEDYLKFVNYLDQCQEFYLGDENGIPSASGTYLYQDINNGAEILALTSNDIEIVEMNFYVSGGGEGGGSQPRVTIYLEAEAVNANPRPKIKLQTTISQRELDID